MCIIDCLSTIVFILPLHLDYTKVIILILWWRNFQLEYWRTFQLVSTHRYMNDAELANYLKVSRRTLQEYRNNGILSYYQIGGKILYRESDIEELLEKNRQEAFR